jgi:hypothetical protein
MCSMHGRLDMQSRETLFNLQIQLQFLNYLYCSELPEIRACALFALTHRPSEGVRVPKPQACRANLTEISWPTHILTIC